MAPLSSSAAAAELAETTRFDVLSIGRVGVDCYPMQTGTGLEDVTSFGKFLGGSAGNVAVAAARYGHRVALISRTGDDPFGRFVRDSLTTLKVDARFVGIDPDAPTPVTFCEIYPPDSFPLYFYRGQRAPDLRVTAEDLPEHHVRAAALLWCTLTGLSQEPSRSAHLKAWTLRSLRAESSPGGPRRENVLDLDYRPMFWVDEASATAAAAEALAHATVAIGNREECRIAVGETDPHKAARALLERGVRLAIVKQGPVGVLAMTADETVEVPAYEVDVVNGLGAGDAFGGAVCHGLLRGWDLRDTIAFASAAGALVASRLECATAMPDETRVRALMDRPAARHRPSINPPALTQRRATDPDAIARAWAARRPGHVPDDGRVLLIAADHPARAALGVRGDDRAMASRHDFLERVAMALSRPGVDGVLGTPDILDDLLLSGLLDDKLVFGSMNRGGLQGATFELDDRFTAYDVAAITRDGLDGGKMLTRICFDDPGSARTLEAAGEAITALSAAGRIAMVEPFLTKRADEHRVVNLLDPDSVITSMHVAAGLGASSAHTWLKIPVVDDMPRVLAATTLPTLLLGGDPAGDPTETYAQWSEALSCPSAVGLVVGRALLFPRDDDVAAAVDIAAGLVHGGTR